MEKNDTHLPTEIFLLIIAEIQNIIKIEVATSISCLQAFLKFSDFKQQNRYYFSQVC